MLGSPVLVEFSIGLPLSGSALLECSIGLPWSGLLRRVGAVWRKMAFYSCAGARGGELSGAGVIFVFAWLRNAAVRRRCCSVAALTVFFVFC